MNLEKIIKYSVPFFVFAILSRAIEEISFFYYAVLLLCLVFIVLLFLGPKFKVNSKFGNKLDNSESNILHPTSKFHLPSSLSHHPTALFLIPGIWFLLTSLWSSYPEVSAARTLYFILISTGCISAGILWIRYFGKSTFDFLLPTNIFIVLLSLFSLITNIPSDSWTGGNGKGFMGLFGQQNLLASVLLFTVPSVFYKLWRTVNSKQLIVNSSMNKIKSPLTTHCLLLTTYSLLLTANLLLLILTYSRSAILSMLIGVIVFLLLNKNWKALIYSLSTAIVVVIIILLNPSSTKLSKDILDKDFPEFYSSRIWMWEPSYRAALDGGFTGLGYGISDPNEKVGGLGDHYEGERFVREKGNSTLALIEETGVIGLILFLLPILFVSLKLVTAHYSLLTTHYSLLTTNCSLLTAALAAFLVHSQFEAWWVGVGSVQLPLFFVYLGLSFSKSTLNY